MYSQFKELKDYIFRHINILDDRVRLKNVFEDVFCNDKVHSRRLLYAYDEGIVEKIITGTSKLEDKNKIIYKLENENDLKSEIVVESVEFWEDFFTLGIINKYRLLHNMSMLDELYIFGKCVAKKIKNENNNFDANYSYDEEIDFSDFGSIYLNDKYITDEELLYYICENGILPDEDEIYIDGEFRLVENDPLCLYENWAYEHNRTFKKIL